MKDNAIPVKLLTMLADGECHSGQRLGEMLGMSRAGVNKYIRRIGEWGVEVTRQYGKGYQLQQPLQLLNADIIHHQLDAGSVVVMPVIDSTNQYLLDRLDSLTSGDVCIAEYQHAGRGRRGRQWLSPFGANLYLSMYWCLPQGPAASVGLSLVVGIAIARVLHQAGAEQVKVKWPNDLYLHDRKLAGILVELTGKTGDAAQLVIGAGINLMMSDNAGKRLDQKWINLQQAGVTIDRNALAVQLIRALRTALLQFQQQGLAAFISHWAELDNFIHRPVKLLIGDQEICGISRGIDNQGALLLEQNGIITTWVGGEISLRCMD